MSAITQIRTALHNFFNPAIAAKQLTNEIKAHRQKIQLLKSEYDALSNWNTQYIATLAMLTEAIQAMVWKKDKNGLYILANPHHCRAFFGFDGSQECLDYIVGKSDCELIETLVKENKGVNSFKNVCGISDKHCSLQTYTVHYLEAGIIDGDKVLFYTIKTPQFTNDNIYIGSIGMAWDVTGRSDFLIEQLNRWVYDGLATKLYQNDKTFCYAIVPKVNQCSLFKHVCPYPHNSNDNTMCDFCEDKNNCILKDKKDKKDKNDKLE